MSYAAPFAIPPASNVLGAAQLATAIGTDSCHSPRHDTMRTSPERRPTAALFAYADGLFSQERRVPDSPVDRLYGFTYATMGSGSIGMSDGVFMKPNFHDNIAVDVGDLGNGVFPGAYLRTVLFSHL